MSNKRPKIRITLIKQIGVRPCHRGHMVIEALFPDNLTELLFFVVPMWTRLMYSKLKRWNNYGLHISL